MKIIKKITLSNFHCNLTSKRQKDRKTERQKDKKTKRQTDRKTEKPAN